MIYKVYVSCRLIVPAFFGRLWPREKWSVMSDLIYSAVELGFGKSEQTNDVFLFLTTIKILYTSVTGYFICEIVILYRSDSEDIMMCIFALIFFWLSIFASFVFTLWNLRASQYRSIQSTYDFIENHDTRNLSMGRWTLLFGKNTFKKRFALVFLFPFRLLSSSNCFPFFQDRSNLC
jgi:hypothetical protein